MADREKLEKDLLKFRNPKQAKILARFFKTDQGEYREGDIFLGINAPNQRKIAKKHSNLSLKELQKLLSNKIHKHRLTRLFIFTAKYRKANKADKKN